MPPILIDTNLLVYLYDSGSPAKAAQARRVLDHLKLTRSGRLSVQSLAKFIRISPAGLKESHVHDVIIMKEAPNYWVD